MEPKTLEDHEISLPLSLRGKLSGPKKKEVYLDASVEQMCAEFHFMFPDSEIRADNNS